MVEALCGDRINRVLFDFGQFHGGAGYLRETTIERMARDARVEAIGGGATEVMLEEVGERMQGHESAPAPRRQGHRRRGKAKEPSRC